MTIARTIRSACLLALAVAGCGMSDPNGQDGGDTCRVSIAFQPAQPALGDTVRAIAVVSNASVRSYDWQVFHANQIVSHGNAQPDGSEIEFIGSFAGPYDVHVYSPKHAPAQVSVTIVAGVDVEAKAVLGPPAKMRVRFVAPETGVIVKFRVLAGRTLAMPFPEGSTTASTEEGGVPVLHAGEEGLVLSGLGPGPHTVEVVSPDLAGGPATVHLVEGETREVEISVVRR